MATPFTPDRFENGHARLLAGLRQYHPFEQIDTAIPEQWRRFTALMPLPDQVTGACYGAICGSDEQGCEYLAGVEVTSFDHLPPEMGRMRLEAQQYAVFVQTGHISTIRDTWSTILHNWLPSSAYISAHAPCFELYDARYDAATGLGGFEIWIPVVPKE